MAAMAFRYLLYSESRFLLECLRRIWRFDFLQTWPWYFLSLSTGLYLTCRRAYLVVFLSIRLLVLTRCQCPQPYSVWQQSNLLAFLFALCRPVCLFLPL